MVDRRIRYSIPGNDFRSDKCFDDGRETHPSRLHSHTVLRANLSLLRVL